MNDSTRQCEPESDILSWTSPFVFGPTLMIVSVLICGERRSYRSAISKLVLYLCFAVMGTFLLDACVMLVRVLQNERWTFNELAYYVGTSWLAWAVIAARLMKESWPQNCIFWGISVCTETIVGWIWINKQGFYDQFSFGIYITRYIVEITILILSLVRSRECTLATPILESTNQSTYGSTVITTRYTTIYKVRTPPLSFKMKGYLFLCFVLICLDVLISVVAPRQMGHIVDDHLRSWSSLLIYVALTFSKNMVHAVKRVLWNHAFSEADVLTNVLEQWVFVLFPVIANTLVLTSYALYVYGVALSIVLFVSTALHIYCLDSITEPIIASGGLLCTSLLFAHKVATCELNSGDFVAFNMYFIQLHSLHTVRTCFEKLQIYSEEIQSMPHSVFVIHKIDVEPETQPVMKKREIQIVHIIEPIRIESTNILIETIDLYEED